MHPLTSARRTRIAALALALTNGVAGQIAAEQAEALVGTWHKPCTPVYLPGDDNNHDIVTMTFDGTVTTIEIENYEDAECRTPFAFAPVATAVGTYTVGAEFTTREGRPATEIDIHVTEFNGALFDFRQYAIFQVDGDTMFFGDESRARDGTSPQTRPDRLETRRPLQRE